MRYIQIIKKSLLPVKEVIKKSLLPVNVATRVLLSDEHVYSEHET